MSQENGSLTQLTKGQIPRKREKKMLNEAMLVGNLGADGDLRQTTDGTPVINLRVATSEWWRDKEGQSHQRTEWHRCVVFGRAAETLKDRLVTGQQVLIKGKMETSSYEDKDGVKRYTTRVVVRPGKGTIRLLGSRKSTEATGQEVEQARAELD